MCVEYKITRSFTLDELRIIKDALCLLQEFTPDYAEVIAISYILERVSATVEVYDYAEV